MLGQILTYAATGIGSIGAIAGVMKGHDNVPQGSLGIVQRLGRTRCVNGKPRIYDPGWLWKLPCFDSLIHIHVVQCTLEASSITANIAGRSYIPEAYIIFSIRREPGVSFAICEIDNFDRRIRLELEQYVSAVLEASKEFLNLDDFSQLLTDQAQARFEPFHIDVQKVALRSNQQTGVTQFSVQAPAMIAALSEAGALDGKTIEEVVMPFVPRLVKNFKPASDGNTAL